MEHTPSSESVYVKQSAFVYKADDCMRRTSEARRYCARTFFVNQSYTKHIHIKV